MSFSTPATVRAVAIASLLAGLPVAVAVAEPLAKPTGPVVLTVTGAIA